MSDTLPLCSNCGAASSTKFCPDCGQSAIHARDLSLVGFLRDSFREVTSLDSKLLRTLRTLITKPGKLTSEYIAGRREQYLKPIQLFLIINVFYFVFLQFVNITTFRTPLHSQLNQQTYSARIRPIVEDHLWMNSIDSARFELAYDHLTGEQAKSLIIVMVPFFALLLSVIFIALRRYYIEHLIYAIHFYSFFLLLCSVGVWIVVLTLQVIVGLFDLHPSLVDSDDALTLIPGVCCIAYFYFASREVYTKKRWALALSSLILAYGLLYNLFLYRLILFFTTFYTVRA